MLGREAGTQHMLAEPLWTPGRTIAGSRKEPLLEGKDDLVTPGPLYLRRQRRTILTPDIVMQPLLSVILISADDEFLGSHRIDSIGRYGANRGEERERFWLKDRSG
jgi:hypothetical protein